MILGGAVGVIANESPVHAALSLVLTLFGVGRHFVAMEAHFLAAVQVIVYAGAIVVLFLFVIMLLGVDRVEQLRTEASDPATAGGGDGRSLSSACSSAAIVSTRDTPPLAVGTGPRRRGGLRAGAPGGVPVDHDGIHPSARQQPVQRQRVAFELTSGAADRRRRRHRSC
jgi:hypothetical protein